MLTSLAVKAKGLNGLSPLYLKKHFPKGMPLTAQNAEKMSELLEWDSLAKAFLCESHYKAYRAQVDSSWGVFLTSKAQAEIVMWNNRDCAIDLIIAARKEFMKDKARTFTALYAQQL